MAGRKPIPTKLKILRGNPGRRPLPENESEVPAGIPEPPKHLKGKGKKEWQRILPELYRAGLVTKIDGAALAAYCDCFALWDEASIEIKKNGILTKGENGEPTINPAVKVSNAAMDRMRKFLVEFGMTPSSRSRVKTAGKPEPEREGADYFGWAEETQN